MISGEGMKTEVEIMQEFETAGAGRITEAEKMSDVERRGTQRPGETLHHRKATILVGIVMTTAEKSTGRGKGLLVGSLKATARERGHDQGVYLVFLPSVDLNQINAADLQLVELLTAQSLSPLGLPFPQFLDLPYPCNITKKGTSLLLEAQRDMRNLTNPG